MRGGIGSVSGVLRQTRETTIEKFSARKEVADTSSEPATGNRPRIRMLPADAN